MTPVPTEYLRREYIYKLSERCKDCPYDEILPDKINKNLNPCDRCKKKRN